MTRDELAAMAVDAGFLHHEVDLKYGDELACFAELVAGSVREQMKRDGWRQCAVGQRTTQFCAEAEKVVQQLERQVEDFKERWRRS